MIREEKILEDLSPPSLTAGTSPSGPKNSKEATQKLSTSRARTSSSFAHKKARPTPSKPTANISGPTWASEAKSSTRGAFSVRSTAGSTTASRGCVWVHVVLCRLQRQADGSVQRRVQRGLLREGQEAGLGEEGGHDGHSEEVPGVRDEWICVCVDTRNVVASTNTSISYVRSWTYY